MWQPTTFHCRKSKTGLTFGEMLVVLAVFSILTIMFLLSSNHAMVRTRISRVMQEQRMLSGALTNFQTDRMVLPGADLGMLVLTTPISYLSTLPKDPFSLAQGKNEAYSYTPYLSLEHKWVIVSVGPDGDADCELYLAKVQEDLPPVHGASISGHRILMSAREADLFIRQFSYDPTNGVVSDGDVILSGGR